VAQAAALALAGCQLACGLLHGGGSALKVTCVYDTAAAAAHVSQLHNITGALAASASLQSS
jgi:hypothetical protein